MTTGCGLGSVALCLAAALLASSASADMAPSDPATVRQGLVRVSENTIACRDLNDMVLLATLRRQRAEEAFLAAYRERKAVGACGPVWGGAFALIERAQDERSLHFVCLRVGSADDCMWADDPSFTAVRQ